MELAEVFGHAFEAAHKIGEDAVEAVVLDVELLLLVGRHQNIEGLGGKVR